MLSTMSYISIFSVNRRLLVNSQTVWSVCTNFHFVAHTQNLCLKTLGRIDIINNKLHLDSQCQQKNISRISSWLVVGNLCHISSCWSPFSFCCSHPEFASKNFRLHWCHQRQAASYTEQITFPGSCVSGKSMQFYFYWRKKRSHMFLTMLEETHQVLS